MQSYKRLKGEKLLMANDYNDKVSRVLSLYQRLMEGEVVDKEAEAARYGVSARSIQRDISAINNFFEQETEKSGVINSIEYDKKMGGHYLSQIYRTRLTNSEILAICKILLDSRAFTRERMDHSILECPLKTHHVVLYHSDNLPQFLLQKSASAHLILTTPS